jgi:hypothetical protein
MSSSSMNPDLQAKISALETEIGGYTNKLSNCSPESEATWANLITERRKTLNILLAQGNLFVIYVSNMSIIILCFILFYSSSCTR